MQEISHAAKKCFEGVAAPTFDHPDHAAGFVIQNHGHIIVAFSNGDLVNRQDAKTTIVSLAVILFQKILINIFNSLPVQSQMLCDKRKAVCKNDVWTLDFVHDRLVDGRQFKCLAILDEYTRENLLLKIGRSITGEDVLNELSFLMGRLYLLTALVFILSP